MLPCHLLPVEGWVIVEEAKPPSPSEVCEVVVARSSSAMSIVSSVRSFCAELPSVLEKEPAQL
jgi:hypothetical protein